MSLPAILSVALLAILGQCQTSSKSHSQPSHPPPPPQQTHKTNNPPAPIEPIYYTSSLPPQSAYTPPPTNGGPGAPNGALPPVSYTYDFTVTTATTDYVRPTFQTPVPVPVCSDDMCPGLHGKVCADEMGARYGVLCDTHLIGIIITTSGKRDVKDNDDQDDSEAYSFAAKSLGERDPVPGAERGGLGSLQDREIDARTFTGSFNGCADYCDMVSGCLGMSFNAGFRGNCQTLALIEGAFPAEGEVAAVRL